MSQCWALMLVMLDFLSTHLVRPELVNEFVIEIASQGNAKEIIESLGFEFIRKVWPAFTSFIFSFMDMNDHI